MAKRRPGTNSTSVWFNSLKHRLWDSLSGRQLAAGPTPETDQFSKSSATIAAAPLVQLFRSLMDHRVSRWSDVCNRQPNTPRLARSGSGGSRRSPQTSWTQQFYRDSHLVTAVNSEQLETRALLSSISFWEDVESIPDVAGKDSHMRATDYDAFRLDHDALDALLSTAPHESTGLSIELQLPGPDGSVRTFDIYESPIMAPELAAAFPEIRTFAGQSTDDDAANLRFDVTPAGFHASVLSSDGSWFVDPYYHLDNSYYAVYFGSAMDATGIHYHEDQIENPDDAAEDGHGHDHDDHGRHGHDHDEHAARGGAAAAASHTAARSGTELRTYRLAVAAAGEYTAFHGGTVASGQAAIVTAINRVNQIYESELSIRMELVGNNDQLVYTNAATDPYSSGIAMLAENQTNVDNVIGNANYDVGHVFHTGGGGVATLRSVGVDGIKARGQTGLPNPVGDRFWVEYVGHELGHQYGGNHTFNGDSGSCAGNINNGTAYEPGSGTTIQSYAGICGNDNLQPAADPYFHSISFDEMIAHVDTRIPTVGTRTATGNNVPTIDAGNDYIIPAATPFVLTATGSDADAADVLTYNWEQRDLGPQADINAGDDGLGPLFRSWTPNTDSSRTFPRLAELLTNTTVLGETLPTTTRTLNFRATVRDNRAGGGGVNTDDVVVNVVDTGSPFAVTSPNSAVSWLGTRVETVTWDVAGTTGNGIDTADVNIRLSTDGGLTWPFTVATNTPNDGNQAIIVPNVDTTEARIRVEGAGNVFFDVSNQNFNVTSVPTDVVIDDITVNEGDGTATFTVGLSGEAVDTVTLDLVATDGTAVDGADFTGGSGQVVIPAGTSSATFSITLLNDTVAELPETFTLSVQSVVTGTVANFTDTGTATIIDNDATIQVIAAASSISEADGIAATTATVTRNTDNSAAMVVNLASTDTTELTVPASVTIPAGLNSVTFNVDAVADDFVDGDQTARIVPTVFGHTSIGEDVDVLDADTPALTLDVAADFVNENAGVAATTATVTRNTDPTNALVVNLLSSNTAEATIIGSVTIPAGQLTSAAVDIDAVDEAVFDGTAVVTFTASAAGFADGTDTLDVLDDETPNVTINIDSTSIAEDGGTANITAESSFAAPAEITVVLQLSGTATGGGTDYNASSTTLTIAAGATTSAAATITALDDGTDEVDETVIVSVDSITNAALDRDFQDIVATIVDGNPAPTVTIVPQNLSVTEGDSIIYEIQLSAASTLDVTVNLAIGGSAAGGGIDFNDPTLQVVIPAGQVSDTVTVTTVDDTIDEGVETVILGTTTMINGLPAQPPQAAVDVTDNDGPPSIQLSVDAISIPEDFGQAVFTVTLSEVSGQDVTVDLDTAGTATPGLDFTITATQLVIPAGSLTASTTLSASPDTLDEFDETAIVSIVGATNATVVAPASAQTTISDDDNAPTVSLSNSSSTVSEGAGSFTFYATLDAASGKDVTVNLLLLGDAVAGTDYTSSPNAPIQLIIPAGSVSDSVQINVTDDVLDEFDELVILEFDSVVNAVENIVQQSAVTVLDNDAPPTLELILAPVELGEASGSNAVLTASLSAVSGKDVTVDLATSGNATTADYTLSQTSIVIAAGSLSATATVAPIDDSLSEPDETITFGIAGSTNVDASGTSSPTFTIRDDEAEPTVSLSIDEATLPEAGGSALITATLSEISGQDVTVDLTFTGSAATGIDYTASAAQIVIPEGSASASISLTAVADALDEFDEDIIATASDATGATLNAAAAQVSTTILDDDATPTLNLSAAAAAVDESDAAAAFNISLTAVSGRDITVSFGLSGTATSGSDYTAVASPLMIPAGQATVALSLPLIDDLLDEFDESIVVDLLTADFAALATTQATTTITDNDAEPVVSLNLSAASIAENGGTATLTASLSAASGRAVGIDLNLSGSATAGLDYAGPGATITIPAGQTSVAVPITAIDDPWVENPDENLLVTVTAATNATWDGNTASTLITDDDVPTLTVSISPGSVNEADGSAAATAVITRNTTTSRELTVSLSSSDTGEATVPATATIPFGQQFITVPIAAVNDLILDGTQTVLLTASSAGFVDGSAAIDITDATTTVELELSATSVIEGSASAVTITARTAKPVVGDQTLNLTVNGTGITVADYNLAAVTLTIPAGQSTASTVLTVINDAIVELDETAVIGLSGLTNGLSAGTVTTQNVLIVNDDTAQLTINDVSMDEGDSGNTTFVFTVSLDQTVDSGVTVNYGTADGSATVADGDYTAASGSVNFVGQAAEQQTISVEVQGDLAVEAHETFLVNLLSVAAAGRNVVLSDASGTGTINNDDAARISIDDVSINEGDTANAVVTFSVTLDSEIAAPVSVDLITADGTATAGLDYASVGTTVTFAAGTGGPQTISVPVTIIADEIVELDEDFVAQLGNLQATGLDVALAKTQGTATIANDDAAELTISDANVAEGDTGSTVLQFTIALAGDVDVPLTVDYATFNGTATTADSDYSFAGGTLNFAGSNGENHSVEVIVQSDTKVELDETLNLVLSNLQTAGRNVTVAGSATGTISNDDAATLSINNATLVEGDSGASSAFVTVTLTGAVDEFVNVDYSTAAGTASAADGDYAATTGTLSFLPNQPGPQTRTIEVLVNGDGKVELDESFFVNLTAVAAGGRTIVVADGQGQIDISNDDSARVSIDNVSTAEGDGTGTTLLTFTVQLDGDVDSAVALSYSTADGSATTADNDYNSATGGIVLFAADAGSPQTQTIQIEVNADDVVERDETFFVNLSGLVAGGRSVTVLDNQGIGTITNDDVATLRISDLSGTEQNSGSTTAGLQVTLLGVVDADVSVSATAVDDTATLADGDYADIGVVAFSFPAHAASGTQQNLDITWNGDEKVELDEQFFVDLFNLAAAGRNVVIEDGRAEVRILNDDSATVEIDDVTLSEGTGGTTAFDFTVTLSGEVDAAVDVQWSTQDGTATVADGDLQLVSDQTVQFAANHGPGAQTQTLTVQVHADGKVEAAEAFAVLLQNIDAAGRLVTLADSSGAGQIQDDDTAAVFIADASITEGDSGNANLTFTVTLSNEVDSSITIDFETAEGSATLLDSDFVQNSGSIVFAANGGSTTQTQTITVQVAGDQIVELDETFFVNLQLQPTGRQVSLSDAQALGTIVNNDTATVLINDVSITEGDAGLQNVTFTVSLDSDVDRNFSIDAETVGIQTSPVVTATSGVDFQPVFTTLNFNGVAGETRDVTVAIIGDQIVEQSETLLLNLTGLSAGGRNVIVSRPSGTATIANDDTAGISISDASITEGDSGTRQLTFNVTLNEAVDTPLTVNYASQDATATSASDYQAVSGTLGFNGTANETRTISVPVLSEIDVENDEQFILQLNGLAAGGRNVTLDDATATGRILNDDQVNLSISDATIREGFRSAGRFLIFTVTRSNNTVPVDVSFATIDGTATVADGDYRAHSGVLNLPAGGPLTANVAVEIVGDHKTEADEVFTVSIQSSSFGATVTDDSAVGTIVQDDSFLSGQKWHDRNANGVWDTNEPALNGWIVEIVDPVTGAVAASTTTTDIDLNGDGTIDPLTERGRYLVPINDGEWQLREVLQNGWRQTHPNGGDALAWELDQNFNLNRTGSLFVNWGGMNEKWMFGDNGWYFITPDGNLFLWNGSAPTELSGQLIGSPGPKFHATPSLLHDAQPPGNSTVQVVAGERLDNQNFGNVPTGSIQGRKYHDVNADGRRDLSEPWMNGWQISLLNSGGQVVAQTITDDVDINGDGIIDPRLERGVYRFDHVAPGDYTVVEADFDSPLWRPSGSSGAFADTAFVLNQRLNFRRPQNSFLNWGGLNEKWLWTNSGWHFVTPDGSIHDWDNSPRNNLTGELVARLNSNYWADLSLLYAASSPAQYSVRMTGQEVVGLHFSNTFAHGGQGGGSLFVTNDLGLTFITGDAADNNIVIYAGQDGQTMVRGVGASSINGRAPVTLLPTDRIYVDLEGGHNQLSIVGVDLEAIFLETVAGTDRMTFEDVTATDVSARNRSGDVQYRWHRSILDSFSYTGDGGLFWFEDTQIAGAVDISSDDIGVTVFAQQTNVSGSVSITTGRGTDQIFANRSSFGSDLSIDTGADHDLLVLRQSQIAGQLTVDSRSGDDTVGVSHGSTVGGEAVVRGGAGTDLLANDGTVPALPNHSFEQFSSSDLDSLIDDVLSNFDHLHLLE